MVLGLLGEEGVSMAARHLPQRIRVHSSDTERRREGRGAHAALDITILECVWLAASEACVSGEKRET